MIINFNMIGLDAYGGTRVIFELVNGLADLGHQVIITTPGKLSDANWYGSDIKATFNFVVVPYFLKDVFKTIFRNDIVEQCLKTKIPACDINIATHYTTAKITLDSKKSIPVYLVQHYEALYSDTESDFCKAAYSIRLPITKVCVSKWLQEVIKYTTMQDAKYIGNGVNLKTFYESNIIPLKRSIMFFSRTQQWKGTKEAKDAIELLRREVPDLNIIEIDTSKRLLDTEIAYLYRTANVFLFTSQYEGFGLPPLEAMACGTPVVTTECIGVNEYVKDGYNALVVDRSPESISSAVQRIFNNPVLANKLRAGGAETANYFNINKTVDSFEKVLIQLVSKP